MNKRNAMSRSYKRRSLRLESLESRDLLSTVPPVSLVAETFKPAFNYTDSKMAVVGTFNYQGHLIPFSGSAKPALPTGTASFSTDTLGKFSTDFTMTGIHGGGTWAAPYNYDYGTFTFANGDLEGTDTNNAVTSGTCTMSIVIRSTKYGKDYFSGDIDPRLTGYFNPAAQKFSLHGTHSDSKLPIVLNMSGGIVPEPTEDPFSVVVSTPTPAWTGSTSPMLTVDVNVPGPVHVAASYTAPAATVSFFWADAAGKAIGKALAPKINIGWNEATGTYNISGLPVPPATAANLLLVPQYDGKTDVAASVLVPLPARPTISIDDVHVTPTPATTTTPATLTTTFTVKLSEVSQFPVTVAYATANGTAIAPTDYMAAAKTLTFAPGVQSQPVTITVKPNAKATGDKLFYVNLKNSTWATIGDTQGECTIIPYAHPTVSIDDPKVTPVPATATTPAILTTTFTVKLSEGSPFPVTVAYATVDGTALARTDYTAAAKTLTFPAWETSKTVTIAVKPNAKATGDKLFYVNLKNPVWTTFENNDSQGMCTITPYAHPSVSITDIDVTRPQTGTKTTTFNLTLSAETPFPVAVTLLTSGGSALSGKDFTAVSKTVTFPPWVKTMPVVVTVKADSKATGNEEFFLNLKSAVWATVGVNQAKCTIKPYTPPVSSSLLQPLASYFDATAQRKTNTTILPTVLDAILAKSGV